MYNILISYLQYIVSSLQKLITNNAGDGNMPYPIGWEIGISAITVIIIYIIMYFLLNKSVEASPFKNTENKPQ